MNILAPKTLIYSLARVYLNAPRLSRVYLTLMHKFILDWYLIIISSIVLNILYHNRFPWTLVLWYIWQMKFPISWQAGYDTLPPLKKFRPRNLESSTNHRNKNLCPLVSAIQYLIKTTLGRLKNTFLNKACNFSSFIFCI
jgi:hypothetical protein